MANQGTKSTETPVSEQDNVYSLKDVSASEKRLTELLQRRQQLAKNLYTVENSLYNLETSYIEDTTYGNIIRGYDSFLANRTPSNRRQRPLDSERIFSQSSISFDSYKAPEKPELVPAYEDKDSDGDYVVDKKKVKLSSTRKKNIIQSDEDQ